MMKTKPNAQGYRLRKRQNLIQVSKQVGRHNNSDIPFQSIFYSIYVLCETVIYDYTDYLQRYTQRSIEEE